MNLRAKFKQWQERRKQAREHREMLGAIERHRAIAAGEIPVPVTTSAIGIQYIDPVDLMYSPKFRKALKDSIRMGERQRELEAQGYEVSYDEFGGTYATKRKG